MKKIGKLIVPLGIYPEKHELMTANLLVQYGDVEFIIPSRTKGVRNPDIIYFGKKWEIKSPRGNGRWTIQEQLRRAVKQSPNVILDMRRSKIDSNDAKRLIESYLGKHKNIKKFILITKDGKLTNY